MKSLVCMLEFPTWPLAKPWSYISGYAVVDALRDLGCEVDVNILMYDSDEATIVKSAQRLVASGRRYEYAFFWLPHLRYSASFWDAASQLSKSRIAVLIESLGYTLAETRRLPHLSSRRSEVLDNLRRCTHVLTFDYGDFRYLENRGYKVFWTPGIAPSVPPDICIPFQGKAPRLLAAGTIYDGRRELHKRLVESSLLDDSEQFEHSRGLVEAFEQASEDLILADTASSATSDEEVRNASERIMTVRKQLWLEYLSYLSGFAGVISLPAFFKGFPGRIFEAMLTNCVAFVCDKPYLRRYKKAFKNGIDVFYFTDAPGSNELKQISEIARDARFREDFTRRARSNLLQHCGAAHILEPFMRWVDESQDRSEMSYQTRTSWSYRSMMRILPHFRERLRFYNETYYEAT